jgi:glycosyltransferase involved in cell wall biosynthesis
MIKVSVIVSAHEDSPFLKEAIESAINQDFEKYEVILSSDGCEELIDYAERYEIDYSFSPKHGHCRALNLAVSRSRGEWIKDVNYDDVLLANCLKDLWEGRRGSMVTANAINFFQIGGEEQFYKGPEVITWETLMPIIHNPVHCATAMYRRDDFLKVGGWDENLYIADDYEFMLNLLSKGYQIFYTDKTVIRYRRHHKQKTMENFGKIREVDINYIKSKYDTRNGSVAAL